MSVRYICTQCEQFFLVGVGAGVAVNCVACGGMAFPAAAEQAQNPTFEDGEVPGDGPVEAGFVDIHDQDTGILFVPQDPYRQNTEVLPSRKLDPGSDAGPHAVEEETSGYARGTSEDADGSSYPSEESEPYYRPHEHNAANLASHALPTSLWDAGEADLYESGEASSEFGSGEWDEDDESARLFKSEHFQLEAMDALDQAFSESESHWHEAESSDDERENTDPGITPYALHRQERSDLHLTLSEEAQAIAGISLDSSPDAYGLPQQEDDTERIVRARKKNDNDYAMPQAKVVSSAAQGDPAQVQGPQLSSPDYVLPARPLLATIAAACLVLGIGLGFVKTPAPVDSRSPLVRDAENRLVEGNRAYADGELERALGHYRSALALQPNYPEAVYARAVVLARQERFEEAATAYREYIELAPEGLYADAVRKVLRTYRSP